MKIFTPHGLERSGNRSLGPRLETLKGKRIGFLWNLKKNGDVLLQNIEQALTAQFEPGETGFHRKSCLSRPASGDLVETLAGYDAVINGVGD